MSHKNLSIPLLFEFKRMHESLLYSAAVGKVVVSLDSCDWCSRERALFPFAHLSPIFFICLCPFDTLAQRHMFKHTNYTYTDSSLRTSVYIYIYIRSYKIEDEAIARKGNLLFRSLSSCFSLSFSLYIYIYSLFFFFFVFLLRSPLLSHNFLPLFQSRHTVLGRRRRKKDGGRKLEGG